MERAFWSLKTVDLKVHPVFHYTASRVRVHVLLCMLAYYVEWHMRRDLAPLLFDDDDRNAAEAAHRSNVAQAKARDEHNASGDPAHCFRTLLAYLATITLNACQPRLPDAQPFEAVTRPIPPQANALQLLDVRL